MTPPYAHIACCVDDSEGSRLAREEARRLHEATGGRLSLVHVATAGVMFAGSPEAPVADVVDSVEASRRWIHEQATQVEDAEPVLLEGDPPSAVVNWARDAGVDLLVAASSRGFLERLLLGSFAGHLTHHAHCSVLLVRPGEGSS